MKPRNREVSIFNMSVLDLLTGALGAFCFLTLALFPYYYKAQNVSAAGSNANAKNAGLKAKNESLKAQLAAEKAAGNQMPPFALLSLSSSNDQNVLRLLSSIQLPSRPELRRSATAPRAFSPTETPTASTSLPSAPGHITSWRARLRPRR